MPGVWWPIGGDLVAKMTGMWWLNDWVMVAK